MNREPPAHDERAALAPLDDLLPSAATIEAMIPDARVRATLPLVDGRLAAPFRATWRDGAMDTFTFEPYDDESPLAALRDALYRAFRALPTARDVRTLRIANVACRSFDASRWLGDPARFLAAHGIPASVERLAILRKGPVSHAGDVGLCSLDTFAPLRGALANVRVLELAGNDGLGKLDLPRLTSLSLCANTASADLVDLARSTLPALTHLEFECDPTTAEPTLREAAMKRLLHARKLPALRSLSLVELDLDDEVRDELLADDDAEDPGTWVDLIADSPRLARLEHLALQFVDTSREHPRLVARAASFAHLASLRIGPDGPVLAHPTRDALREALAVG